MYSTTTARSSQQQAGSSSTSTPWTGGASYSSPHTSRPDTHYDPAPYLPPLDTDASMYPENWQSVDYSGPLHHRTAGDGAGNSALMTSRGSGAAASSAHAPSAYDPQRTSSPVAHLARLYRDDNSAYMHHHASSDWSDSSMHMPAPPRHSHSAAPSLGTYHPSSGSAPPAPTIQPRAASIARMPGQKPKTYPSGLGAHSYLPGQAGSYVHTYSPSTSASDSESNSSVPPPLKSSDGTVSPPTTIGSVSSSENLKLASPPPAVAAETVVPSSTMGAATQVPAAGAASTDPPKQKYPGAKRGRKPKPPPTPEEARRNREAYLEKNRVAALHSRQRKKVKTGNLETQANELSQQNQHLQQFARDLHVELMQLRALLARLPPGFADVDGYLDREANGGGIPTIMSIAGPTFERDYTSSSC